jgi:hypothetical protein
MIGSFPRKKSRDHLAAFLFSACGFFQRPPQHIQSITAILDQHVRSIGEMLQVVSFGFFDAQAGEAVEQIARGFESVDGSFKKIGSAGFGVDVQRRADAEVALERVVFRHDLNLI